MSSSRGSFSCVAIVLAGVATLTAGLRGQTAQERRHARADPHRIGLTPQPGSPTVGGAADDTGATSIENFFLSGTQPDQSGGVEFEEIIISNDCRNCHETEDVPIFNRWVGSPKAQAARDPIMHAALAIAEQDAPFAGDLCLRCHTPGGWLAGRSDPTDGSALIQNDFDGVNCNFCHRMVDPIYEVGVSPPEDEPILAALEAAGLLPTQFGNGSYVVEKFDVRRGPFNDVPENYHPSPILYSPFHTTADLCGTCHDVSNPAFVRQPDGSYALNAPGAEHPTGDKFEMFPLERTYSEWANSDYAGVGVDAGGVFGGNHPTGVMRTCQDCHMPDTEAYGSGFTHEPFFVRPDVPAHDFNGGNTWLPILMDVLYPWTVEPWYLAESQDRAAYMLQNAATLDVVQEDCSLRVRITNETGHKLPTGYPEGRRMWLTVRFYGDQLELLAERGSYDAPNADLTASDTKVYEVKLGIDADLAAATGYAEGPSFHFALNNKIYKDNRIPPRGFTNAAFMAVQAAPVAARYDDGQYWDDTHFFVPPGATRAVVQLYYQTASKEYITFLRDENRTNDAGDILHDAWTITGKSLPVLMAEFTVLDLAPGAPCDANCDGAVTLDDFGHYGACISGPQRPLSLGCESLDTDLDGDTDLRDWADFQGRFRSAP